MTTDPHAHIRALLAKRQKRYIRGVKIGIAIDVVCLAVCLYNFVVERNIGWVDLSAVTIALLGGACYDLSEMRKTLDQTRKTLV